jgi:hypothetical protein
MSKKKSNPTFDWSRESSRVQSLGDGNWVRVFDHRGKSHHIKVDSGDLPALVETIAKGDEDCARRIGIQLDTLVPDWRNEDENESEDATNKAEKG